MKQNPNYQNELQALRDEQPAQQETLEQKKSAQIQQLKERFESEKENLEIPSLD